MKKIIIDIAFIVLLAILLVILSETGQMDIIMTYPLIPLLATYLMGRFISKLMK